MARSRACREAGARRGDRRRLKVPSSGRAGRTRRGRRSPCADEVSPPVGAAGRMRRSAARRAGPAATNEACWGACGTSRRTRGRAARREVVGRSPCRAARADTRKGSQRRDRASGLCGTGSVAAAGPGTARGRPTGNEGCGVAAATITCWASTSGRPRSDGPSGRSGRCAQRTCAGHVEW